MLQQEQLDAVMVLIDADKQAPVICDCLEAGLHVMAEVPLCYTIEDCWRIVTTVERSGKVFLLMEQIRYAGYVRAWREVVASGVLGDIVLAEGEYFHNLPLRMFQDSEGVYHTAEHADRSPDAAPTWRMHQPPIVYLPHDLSPVLHVLDDRVTRVTATQSTLSTPTVGRHAYPAMQMALMNTEKDAVLRMGVSFSTAAPERHWQHIKGAKGYVEMPRGSQGSYLFWADHWQLPQAIAMPWGLPRIDGPSAARGSGHGDCDFYVFAAFADAVLRDASLEFDVYRAAEITAPAIAAAESIRLGGQPVAVPDFRPGPGRQVPDQWSAKTLVRV
jgi:predicted dehydrogenase